MTEQERVQKRRERQRTSRAESSDVRLSGNKREGVERKLQEVDAAFDDFLASGGTTSEPGQAIGEQGQPHQVIRPLSDEALVQGFRQTSGE